MPLPEKRGFKPHWILIRKSHLRAIRQLCAKRIVIKEGHITTILERPRRRSIASVIDAALSQYLSDQQRGAAGELTKPHINSNGNK